MNALVLDERLARVVLDRDRCIGCRICTMVCPFGVIRLDPIGEKIVKCDLCDGEPACVASCVYDALEYQDPNLSTVERQRDAAEMLLHDHSFYRHRP